jgi:large subunit ribosomal protein L35
MPKLKTHKSSKKRFRVTATGKVKHRGTGTSHRLSRMTHKQKRNLRGTRCLCDIEAKRVLNALHGGSY